MPAQDWDAAAVYLAAYHIKLPLDTIHLDYYRVRRLIIARYEGERGHAMWRTAAVHRSLIEQILTISGVHLQPEA